jgi:hypothetical protein
MSAVSAAVSVGGNSASSRSRSRTSANFLLHDPQQVEVRVEVRASRLALVVLPPPHGFARYAQGVGDVGLCDSRSFSDRSPNARRRERLAGTNLGSQLIGYHNG